MSKFGMSKNDIVRIIAEIIVTIIFVTGSITVAVLEIPGVRTEMSSYLADEITIISPLDNDEVNMSDIIIGTAKDNNLNRQVLWIVVSDAADDGARDNGRYFPQVGGISEVSNHKWTQQIQFGDEIDKGKRYKIYAILANPTENEILGSYCLGRKSSPMNYSTFQSINDNIAASVTVTRI